MNPGDFLKKIPEFKPLSETIESFEAILKGGKRKIILSIYQSKAVIIERKIAEPIFYQIIFQEINLIENKEIKKIILGEIHLEPWEERNFVFKFDLGNLDEVIMRLKNNYPDILQEFCKKFLEILYNSFRYFEMTSEDTKKHLKVFINLFEQYKVFSEEEIRELKNSFVNQDEKAN